MAGFTPEWDANVLDDIFNSDTGTPSHEDTYGYVDVATGEIWIKPTKTTPPSRYSAGTLATEIAAVQIKGGSAALGTDLVWTITEGLAGVPSRADCSSSITGGIATANVNINGFNLYNGDPDAGSPQRIAWDKLPNDTTILENNSPLIVSAFMTLGSSAGVGGLTNSYAAVRLDTMLNSPTNRQVNEVAVDELWLVSAGSAPTDVSAGTVQSDSGLATPIQLKGGNFDSGTDIPWNITMGGTSFSSAISTQTISLDPASGVGTVYGYNIYNGNDPATDARVAWSVLASTVSTVLDEVVQIPTANTTFSLNSTAEV